MYKKLLLNILVFISVFFINTFLFSQENNIEKLIIGSWKIEIDDDGSKYSNPEDAFIVALKNENTVKINEDKSCNSHIKVSNKQSQFIVESTSTWSIQNNIITITYYEVNDKKNYTETYEITVNNNNLIFLLLTTNNDKKSALVNKFKMYSVKQ